MAKCKAVDNRPFTLHIYYDRHNQPHVSTDLTDNYKSTGSPIDPVIAKMLTDVRNYAVEAHLLRTSNRVSTKTPLLPTPFAGGKGVEVVAQNVYEGTVEHTVK